MGGWCIFVFRNEIYGKFSIKSEVRGRNSYTLIVSRGIRITSRQDGHTASVDSVAKRRQRIL